LGHEFSVDYVFADPKDENKLAGLDILNETDVLLISVRRRALPREQLAAIRRFVEEGKPVIGIRTASHAFALRNAKPPEGRALWPEFDSAILGGNYSNHHGDGPKVEIEAGIASHPILNGLDITKLVGNGSLYVTKPLAKTATPLLIGSIPGKDSEPVAWINRAATGNRVFYTSLGHVDDFKNPEFQKLLKNAIVWAASEAGEK
jgi:type 1 glutamine amidotransferase